MNSETHLDAVPVAWRSLSRLSRIWKNAPLGLA
jgi:hypothetical protein